jgi:NAD(P)-dependent dehydrogenase (short-subunit alcohol dehydrogenase family)/acyl carrier protein
LIDLESALSAAAVADLLWMELAVPSADNEIAFGAQGRFVTRLAKLSAPAAPAWRWQRDAGYLITGGLGDLGMLVARWMAEQGARRLILMGRTPLPPRRQWTTVDPNSRTGQQIAAVRSLEALGAAVHLAAVDVGEEEQLAAFLAGYEAEGWPSIRGVMHVAGTVRDRLLADMAWDEMAEVMHAKVAGSWLLHKLLPDLDFFVLFSSLGSLLGQPGQGNYAAANAFLDALAQERRRAGQAGLSINWGPWSGIGFAAAAGGRLVTHQLAQQGIGALDPVQGLDVLRRLLGTTGEGQVAVLPLAAPAGGEHALPHLLRELRAAQAANVRAPEQSANEVHASMRTSLLALEPAQRRATLGAYLQQAVAQVLRMSPARVGMAMPLGSLGLDSLMALELRNRLEVGLDIRLPATFVWNYPTVHDLVPYLAARMDVALEATVQGLPPGTDAMQARASTTQEEIGAAALDQLLAGVDALSDEGALDLLRRQ